MKHYRLLPVWAIALALGLSFGTLSLVACSSDGSEKPSQGTEKTDDASDTTADTEDQTTEDSAAVWVVNKQVTTYSFAEDESSVELAYELDDQGNVVTFSQIANHESDPYVATNTFDEDGYIVKTEDGMEGGETITYTLEKDEQGRLTKSTGSDGTVEEITYDDAGNIAKRVITGSSYGEDPDGNWSVVGTYSSTTTYDADGRMVSILSDNNGYYQLLEKSFEFNDAGQVVSVTNTNYAGEDSENLEPDASGPLTATVEYDENGNVARVLMEGDSYTQSYTYEYTLVEHPSLAARLNARIQHL